MVSDLTIPLKPNRTALLVIDMQRGFLDPGAPIEVPDGQSIIPKISTLVSALRPLGVRIVWTQVSLDNLRRGPYSLLFPGHFPSSSTTVMSRNATTYEICPELLQLMTSGDILIQKDRYSAFYQTSLEIQLRQLQIESLLFAGVTTNVCVESTIRDAFNLDFYSVLLSDCTMTFSRPLQEHAEQVVAFVFGQVMQSEEVITLLQSAVQTIEPNSTSGV